MISTLTLGLAASKAATVSETVVLEVLSQVASFRVTDSLEVSAAEAASVVLEAASVEAAVEVLDAEAPQPASMVPTIEAASSMETVFFMLISPSSCCGNRTLRFLSMVLLYAFLSRG